MNVSSLIKSTKAFEIFKNDKINGTLSHATLIVCDDSFMLEKYVKVFVKTLMCNSEDSCDNCRVCKLIDSKTYEDAKFYPTENKIVTEDIDDLIARSYLKPLESDKKVFVLLNAQEMNTQSQNKLLKTLEEPPKDTYIILGATSVFTLLPTVISRVKKLQINSFNDSCIINFLKDEYKDENQLKYAVKLANGKIGEAINRYNLGEGKEIEDLVFNVFINMKNSKDVCLYSSKINKENIKDVISIFIRFINDVLRYNSGKEVTSFDVEKIKKISQIYSSGALLFALEEIKQLEKALYFNGNVQALSDNLLFGLLEGKHIWSK